MIGSLSEDPPRYHVGMMSKSAVLVANGPLVWTEELLALCAEADVLLAADGGANHLARVGLRPQRVIGDLDSLLPTVRRWLGEEMLLHRPDQDRTDLEKTLEFAAQTYPEHRLTVLGALGGRIDHEMGNLGLLVARRRGVDLIFRGQHEVVLAVEGEVELEAQPGETWSFWTFDPAVLVTVAGVRWPVTRQPLTVDGRPSISNVATEHVVEVEAEGGAVLVRRQLMPGPARASHQCSE